MDLAPQYSSVLTGIVRSGVLGASISTAIAGTLRQKVGFYFPHFFKIRFYISKIIRKKKIWLSWTWIFTMLHFSEYTVMAEDLFNNRISTSILCCVLFCVWVRRTAGMGPANLQNIGVWQRIYRLWFCRKKQHRRHLNCSQRREEKNLNIIRKFLTMYIFIGRQGNVIPALIRW